MEFMGYPMDINVVQHAVLQFLRSFKPSFMVISGMFLRIYQRMVVGEGVLDFE